MVKETIHVSVAGVQKVISKELGLPLAKVFVSPSLADLCMTHFSARESKKYSPTGESLVSEADFNALRAVSALERHYDMCIKDEHLVPLMRKPYEALARYIQIRVR